MALLPNVCSGFDSFLVKGKFDVGKRVAFAYSSGLMKDDRISKVVSITIVFKTIRLNRLNDCAASAIDASVR